MSERAGFIFVLVNKCRSHDMLEISEKYLKTSCLLAGYLMSSRGITGLSSADSEGVSFPSSSWLGRSREEGQDELVSKLVGEQDVQRENQMFFTRRLR